MSMDAQQRTLLKEDIARDREKVEKMLAEAEELQAALRELPEGSKERERLQAAFDVVVDAAKALAESTYRRSSEAVKSL